MADLEFASQGRSRKSVASLLCVAGALLALLFVGTHWGVVAFLALFAVPNLVDVLFNPSATFLIDDTGLHWKNATQEADIDFARIISVKVFTRLNVAFRVTLIMDNDGKVRIPRDVLPPRQQLEAAFADHNILVEHERLRLI
ncbi:hypothetical protein NBRC116594_36320 [Shimia sp. NS0008-38b]|uniref:hypothetical protein n=1 Tax=Shimia sp. NS0008-38b TaxID=3127653 RepID=UPI0031066689